MIIMKMRDKIKGRLGQALLFVLFLTMFAGLGISRFAMRFLGSTDAIAVVNGTEITTHAFNYAVQDADQKIQMIRRQYGQQADIVMQLYGISNNPQQTALQQVIYNALLEHVANKMHITLSKEYLEVRLGNPQFIISRIGHVLPSYIYDAKLGVNTPALMEFLHTPAMRFTKYMLEQELRNQFALLITQAGFYYPQFVSQALLADATTDKKFEYQVFTLSDFVAQVKKEKVTDADLQAFYTQENKASQKYWLPETRQATVWNFTPDTYGITVTEKEIKHYYDAHKRTRYISVPAQFKVREIIFSDIKNKGINFLKEEAESVRKKALEAPDTFADLAKTHSQGSTAKTGGLVEYFKRGTKEKAYEKAVVRLKENGAISPVIQLADGGWALVQLVDRKEAQFKPLSEVKNAIITSLKNQKFKSEFTKNAQKVVGLQDKILLDEFIKDHNGVQKEISLSQKADDPVARRLFYLKKEGQAIAFMHDTVGTIMQLDKKHPKKVQKFTTVEEQVRQDYYDHKAKQALEKAAQEAKEYAYAHKKLSSSFAKISSTEYIALQDAQKIEKYQKEGFPQDFMHMNIQGALQATQLGEKTTLVLLSELKKSEKAVEADKKNDWFKDDFARFHQLFSLSFIASLYRNATIKVNEQMNQRKI